MWMIAPVMLAMLAEAPASVPKGGLVKADACEIIRHPDRYDGKSVEFFGFRRADIEMLLINGPECRDDYLVIGDNVQGRWDTFFPEVRGDKWFLPSGVFRGRVRVFRDGGRTAIVLEDGVIVSSGVSEYAVPR